ncbi:MAG: hypothetical protein NZ736_07250 [Candidatus Poseidoniaceae archaeon]|nr:hypothetical protein [Candidatus Poseidoniaceae archaeon]
MEGLRRSETAELALGALISFIGIMVTSAVMASVLVGIVQITFSNSHEHAATQSETLNGIIQVNRFELSSYSALNTDTDGIYLVFEFPFILNDLADTDVVWSMLCPDASEINFISGDFVGATEIGDDGVSDGLIDVFTNSGMYHMFIAIGPNVPVSGTPSVCDISPDHSAELTIAINGGRTTTIPFEVGSNPYAGMIFI